MNHSNSNELPVLPSGAPGPWAEDALPRILLYSHDSWGLGHLRRNLTLSAALGKAFPQASMLLVTGSACATLFTPPPRVELIKLPSITKDPTGAYVPRSLPGSLESVLELRSELLLAAFRSFAPDLVIIDHQVIGLHGEALPLLREARSRGAATLLGLRDIIDSPDSVLRDWDSPECRWAFAEGYDRVCVYGAPEVFDPRSEYSMDSDLAERVEFTGYVVRESLPASRRPVPATRPQVLVTAGGGEDGAEHLETYLDSLELEAPEWDSVILTGPLMNSRRIRHLKRRASLLPRVSVHRFHSDLPRLLDEASVVVSMAGYNSCAEILKSRTPAVLIPRTRPRQEQLIRARRFERLGLARCLENPDPAQLRSAVDGAFEHRSAALPRGVPPQLPRMNGGERLSAIVQEMLGVASASSRSNGKASYVS
jgi:predicted glycosyltransferase